LTKQPDTPGETALIGDSVDSCNEMFVKWRPIEPSLDIAFRQIHCKRVGIPAGRDCCFIVPFHRAVAVVDQNVRNNRVDPCRAITCQIIAKD